MYLAAFMIYVYDVCGGYMQGHEGRGRDQGHRGGGKQLGTDARGDQGGGLWRGRGLILIEYYDVT